MSPSQAKLTSLLNEESSIKEKMTTLSGKDELSDEERSQMGDAEARYVAMQVEVRTARTLVETEDRASLVETGTAAPDPEQRERVELRSRASVGKFLAAALRGRLVDGAEAELQQAAGVDGIPTEMWEQRRTEDRAITAAPATGTGVNLEPLIPQVFSPSIAARMMIDMPMVPSGTFSTARVVAGADPAAAVAKSAVVPEIASTWEVKTTTAHRIGGALRLTLEDIATVGSAGFEQTLRQHISLLISDELDDQMINGDSSSTATDIDGLFAQLTNPSAPAAAVETWTRFLAIQSAGIDGLWATELMHIGMVVGVDTYRLAAATFQGTDSEQSAASYLKAMGAGDAAFFTNSRMPATAANIQQGIMCKKGRSMMPSPMRVAVCPSWGFISIDDIYTGASKGERVFTINTLVGDVILTQPSAFEQIAFRVSV